MEMKAIYLQGIISVVELSFMVHEPRGIIEWTRETSLFSSRFMYRTMSVSEWWVLNTGWVMYWLVRWKVGEERILPLGYIGLVTLSATW